MDLSHYRRWFSLPDPVRHPPEPDLRGHEGPRPAVAPPTLRVFSYGPDGLEEAVVPTPAALQDWRGRRAVTWVDVDGIQDRETLHGIAGLFGLHALAEEDVNNPVQRPKAEHYDDHLFLVARMLFEVDGRVESEQLSLFLGSDFVLTFQQSRPGDCLEGVRQRLRTGEGRLRRKGPDFLAWALLDAVVDAYSPLLESFGERLDDLEDDIVERPAPELIADIHQAKRDLMALRRASWPLRDALASMLRDEEPLVRAETRPFLRDCQDHVAQVLDGVETYREIAWGLMGAHQSSVGNRMNQVMKVLTIIATVFMPLQFLAGVYGMNFVTDGRPWNMPELGWAHGYLFFWVVALSAGAGMMAWFRYKGWWGRHDE